MKQIRIRLYFIFLIIFFSITCLYATQNPFIIKQIDLEISALPKDGILNNRATFIFENKSFCDFSCFFDTTNFKIIKLVNENNEEIKLENPESLFVKDVPPGIHKWSLFYSFKSSKESDKLHIVRENLIQLWEYSMWHPTLMTMQAIDYNIKIVLPKNSDLIPVTCGDFTKSEIVGDKKIYYWVAHNIVKGLVLFAAPYSIQQKTINNIKYSAYTLDKPTKKIGKLIDFSQSVVEFMSSSYYPYPYNTFTIIEAPVFSKNNGRGINSLIILDSSIFDKIDEYTRSSFFLPHEISHTYWGGVINPSLDDLKMLGFNLLYFTEAFANYTAMEYFIKKNNQFALENCFLRYSKDFYVYKKEDVALELVCVDFRKINKPVGMSKLAFMHFYTAKLIGFDNYDKAIHKLIKKHKFSDVDFNEFKLIILEYSKNKPRVDFFLQLWLKNDSQLIPDAVEFYFN